MHKHIILGKGDVLPSSKEAEVIGIFNPGVAVFGEKTILLARVAERPIQRDDGFLYVPDYSDGKATIKALSKDDPTIDFSDARVIKSKDRDYLTSVSHFSVFESVDGLSFAPTGISLFPASELESFGVEDPRITPIGGRYFITYAGVSPHGISVMEMETVDFTDFQRNGAIFAPDNKDCALFPNTVNGSYLAVHRPCSTNFGKVGLWISSSPDLVNWGHHRPFSDGEPSFVNSDRIGIAASPILIDAGWLVLCHCVDDLGRYVLYTVLLNKDNPEKAIMRSTRPLVTPTETYETNGFFANVVFSCGMVKRGLEYWIYYGAGDESIAVAVLSEGEIMSSMEEIR